MSSRKHYLSFFLLLVLLLALAGCGSVSVNGAIQPTPTPRPPALPRRAHSLTHAQPIYLWHHRLRSGRILCRQDQQLHRTGHARFKSTPIANPLGQNIVFQLVADPKGRFLYALDLGASSFGIQFGQIGISAFQINRSSGILTPTPARSSSPRSASALWPLTARDDFYTSPTAAALTSTASINPPGS